MLNIDFKITTWERVSVPTEHKDKVLEALNSGEIQTSNDLIEFIEDANFDGIMEETSEQLTVEDNGNQPTIEIIDEEDGNTI